MGAFECSRVGRPNIRMIEKVGKLMIVFDSKLAELTDLFRRYLADHVEPALRRQPAQLGEFAGCKLDVDAEAIVAENLRQRTAQARYRRSDITVQQVHAFPSGISLIPPSYAKIDAPAN